MLLDKNNIYYNFYNPAGLFNQALSLEIASGLQYKTNRNTVMYNVSNNLGNNAIFSPSFYSKIYPDMVSQFQKIRIDDLFIWNNSENFYIFDKEIDINLNQYEVCDIQKSFFIENINNKIDLKSFGGNREMFIMPETPVNFINTLNLYSYFFYNKDDSFIKHILSVKPKKEYEDLAKKIAESLKDFFGIHLRLTDFPNNMYSVSQHMFDEVMMMSKDYEKTVISTDDPYHIIFNKYRDDVIFLDSYIYNNFKEDFKKLTFNDDIVFGLINNLVLHYSGDFVGTQGSTFTSYIQRNRIKKGMTPSWKMFNDLVYLKKNKYSWIGYNIDETSKCWWREWEEC